MNSNPIHHPSSANKMKCSFLDYVQFLMISRACWWTWTPSTTCLLPKNEMHIFWLCSTSDDWPGWSMDSNTICHPSPAKKMKCSFLYYIQLLMIGQAEWWTQTPSTIPLQPKKWNAHFWITFNFWRLVGLVDGLKPHLPPVSSQKNEILVFVLHWTSDDQLGWLIDSNLICHPSPAKKMKCSFLDFVQLLMIGWAGWWTRTPSTTPLHPKKLNAHFWIMFNFWWSAGLLYGLKPIFHLSPAKKNEMLIFWSCSTSDDQLGWSMDLNPICQPSPPKKMKCSFLDYVQLLMIGLVVNGLKLPLPALSSQRNEMLLFGLRFKFWWSAGLVNGLKPHPPPLSSQKSEMLIFVLHSTSDVGQTGQWTWTSSTTPLQPKIWNAHFWVTFNFWWLVGLFDELKPHLPSLSSLKNEMLIF